MSTIVFHAGGNGDNGDITVSDPDGAYLAVRDDFAQVVIVGPMRWAPIAYEAALRDELGEEFEICGASFLGTDNLAPPLKLVALRRGIVALSFKRKDSHGKQADGEGKRRG